jgi:hypothetical protein
MYNTFNWRENRMMEFQTHEELGRFQYEDYRSTCSIPDSEIDNFTCHFSQLPPYHPFWWRKVEQGARERVEMLRAKLDELDKYMKEEWHVRLHNEYCNTSEHYDIALETYNRIVKQRKVKQVQWSAG